MIINSNNNIYILPRRGISVSYFCGRNELEAPFSTEYVLQHRKNRSGYGHSSKINSNFAIDGKIFRLSGGVATEVGRILTSRQRHLPAVPYIKIANSEYEGTDGEECPSPAAF